MIILDLHFWDIERFAKICEYGFLAKADFSDNWEISQLSKILPGHSFVVFYYSEWAELIDQRYSVVFKDGVYQKCDEIVYRSFDSIGISYDFVNETRYFSYYNAKESYLTTEQ